MSTPRDFTVDEHVVDHLPAYVNGTLPPAERAAIDAHLERCPGCATELAAWRVIRAATRSTASHPATAPASVLDRLWVAIDQLEESARMERMPVQASMPHGLSLPDRLHPHRTGEAGRADGSGGPQRVLALLATAALVLLTLGASYVAFQRSHTNRESGQPASIPALVAPATLTPGLSADETLLAVALPAEAIPSGDGGSSGLLHATIPPGTQGSWQAPQGTCCSGLRVDYVLEGSYTVRASGPMQVVRASTGGTPETVPADAELVLAPGDAMIGPNETTFMATNTGSTPVQLLAWNLLGGSGADAQVPANWVQHVSDVKFALTVPAEPATVRLRRITLPPQGELPAPSGGLQFGVTLPDYVAGTPVAVYPSKLSDGTIRSGAVPVTIYVLTFVPTGPGMETSTPSPARE